MYYCSPILTVESTPLTVESTINTSQSLTKYNLNLNCLHIGPSSVDIGKDYSCDHGTYSSWNSNIQNVLDI